MPVFIMTAWTFVKKYWAIFAAIAGFVLFRFMENKDQADLAKTLDDINKKHAQELADLQKDHDVEEQQRAANEAKMQAQMAAIEKQYEAAQQQLDAEKKVEIQQIITSTQDNPDLLAQKLAAATGFQVVLPPDTPPSS